MDTFNNLQTSDVRQKIYAMNNKESSVEGITVKILKIAFQAVAWRQISALNK